MYPCSLYLFPFVLFQFGLAYVWNLHRVEIMAASIALASHRLFPVGPKLWHCPLHPEYTDLSSSWLIKLAPSSRCLLLILFRIALASSFCDWLILIFSSLLLRGEFLKPAHINTPALPHHTTSAYTCIIAVFIRCPSPSSVPLEHKLLQWMPWYMGPTFRQGFFLCAFSLNIFSRAVSSATSSRLLKYGCHVALQTLYWCTLSPVKCSCTHFIHTLYY